MKCNCITKMIQQYYKLVTMFLPRTVGYFPTTYVIKIFYWPRPTTQTIKTQRAMKRLVGNSQSLTLKYILDNKYFLPAIPGTIMLNSHCM